MNEKAEDLGIMMLGDEEIELIARIQREGMILQGRMIGILDSFVKRNGLEGHWELSENGREIIRK